MNEIKLLKYLFSKGFKYMKEIKLLKYTCHYY